MESNAATDPERLKGLIQEEGHTYRTLADEIGITPQAVSQIVNGKTTSSTARYSLAKALGRDVEELWPEEGVAA